MLQPQEFHHSEEVLLKANLWLTRFEPLVKEELGIPDVQTVRGRLGTVHALREEYQSLEGLLHTLQDNQGLVVASTIRQAASQLGSIQGELQRALALLTGEPSSKQVDLQAIQDILAERQAKQELGVSSSEIVPEVLELRTSNGNWAAASGFGLFGLGWTSFTLIHSILFIGGFKQAIGWLALGFLGFYSIFYAVGIGMLVGALNTASIESIRMEGDNLIVRRTLGRWVREKTYVLDARMRAAIGRPQTGMTNGNKGQTRPAVLLNDVRGKEIALCRDGNHLVQQDIVEQINRYRKIYGG